MNIQVNKADTRNAKVDAILEQQHAKSNTNAANIEALWDALITVAATSDIDAARAVREAYEKANPGTLA